MATFVGVAALSRRYPSNVPPASRDRAAVVAQVRSSYSTPEALAIYRKRVDQGLRIWETTVIRQHFPARGRVLTLGCGAGRETFALEQLGYDNPCSTSPSAKPGATSLSPRVDRDLSIPYLRDSPTSGTS
jgi:hypothetical protein